MAKQVTFDSLFEGMDLTPEFAEKLKTVFEDAVQTKVNELQEKADNPYAVGMSAAMKNTGDKPPLKKSTIKKAHKIAKAVAKESVEEPELEDDELEEDEELVTLESEEEVLEAEGEEGETNVDPRELSMDVEMRKILNALKVNPAAFARSLQSAILDIEGNNIADDAFNSIVEILKAVAEDPITATRLAALLKKEAGAEPTEPAMKEEDDPTDDLENSDENVEVFETVVESINSYLTYVAESWVEDNKVAVEQGLKYEILESFFKNAKNLFVEHNIVVPEGVDTTEKLNEEIAALKKQLETQKETYESKINEEISKTVQFKNRVEKEIKNNIFESVSKDLTVVQKERFKKLVESVVFESKQSYEDKLKEIAKNAFEVSTKSSKKNLTEEALNEPSENDQATSDNPIMNLYADAISKNLKF